MANKAKSYLGMSDDEFLNEALPEVLPDVTSDQKEASGSDNEGKTEPAVLDEKDEETPEKSVDQQTVDEKADTKAADDEDTSNDDPVAVADGDEQPEPKRSAPDNKPAKKSAEARTGDDEKGEAKVDDAPPPVNYEEFYHQVMKPFKANGRMIKLNNAEEVIRMLQMGAGFGRKIQEIQPHLKVLRMLEKNDLLDEEKLSFLIDVNQRNPGAIQKLIKESGIDPLDFNENDNINYEPGNHAVTDNEVAFRQAVADIEHREGGPETLQIISQTWDQKSKAALWESPEILSVIQDQRENGAYDKIAAEVERQRALGLIPLHTPFLEAYKIAGDFLVRQAGYQPSPTQAPGLTQPGSVMNQPQVIESRPAVPKTSVVNSDKAAAAAPSKSVQGKKRAYINPLAMSDDDFLKQFEGRL